MPFRQITALALLLAMTIEPVAAGNLVYTPVNPSFGGNSLNSSHLLGLASAQRRATAVDADLGGDGGSPTDPGTGTSDVDLFVRQLQGRLLSALASQVTEAIFGQNPQESGLITFGTTLVSFERTIDSIILIIEDTATGQVTEIIVPQLVSP
jgi:curli production assembly/transport component CsgF